MKKDIVVTLEWLCKNRKIFFFLGITSVISEVKNQANHVCKEICIWKYVSKKDKEACQKELGRKQNKKMIVQIIRKLQQRPLEYRSTSLN